MIKSGSLQKTFSPRSLGKHALQGAGLALLLLTIFLLLLSTGNIDYGAWVFLPMLTVSVGGALGGLFFSLMAPLRYQGGWKKVLANSFCIVVYILCLWLSLIAALSVTGHWD